MMKVLCCLERQRLNLMAHLSISILRFFDVAFHQGAMCPPQTHQASLHNKDYGGQSTAQEGQSTKLGLRRTKHSLRKWKKYDWCQGHMSRPLHTRTWRGSSSCHHNTRGARQWFLLRAQRKTPLSKVNLWEDAPPRWRQIRQMLVVLVGRWV